MFLSRYEKWLNSIFSKDKKIKNENDLFNLNHSTIFWQNELFARCQRLFVWDGLPFPQREIENLLLMQGCGCFVKSNKFKVSKYAITPCTWSGVTEYPDVGVDVRWVTPIANGTFKMQGGDGVVIRNNSLTQSIRPLINRYAILLANIDISLVSALVNERCQNVFVADTQNVADSINNFYKTIEEDGKRKAIVNERLFQTLQGAISLPAVQNKDSIKSILSCYDSVLQMFYNDIGIRYNKDKKERMVESEVTSDSQRLLINIKDMLECRQKACDEINDVFGLNVTVKMSNEIVLAENDQTQPGEESKKIDSPEEPEEQQTAEEQKENVDYSF